MVSEERSFPLTSTTLENAPIGIYRIGPEGSLAYANRRFLEILGFASLADFHSSSHAMQFRFHRLLETPSRRSRDTTVARSTMVGNNGVPVSVVDHSRAILEDDGRFLGIEGFIEPGEDDPAPSSNVGGDVPETNNEELFRKLIEISPDGLLVHDKGRVLYANPACVSIMRASSVEQLYAMPLLNFVHPESRAVVMKRFAAMSERGAPAPAIEERFVRLDGTTIDVEVAAAPFVLDGKTIYLVVVRDITERKQVQAMFRQRRRLLEMMFQGNAAVMTLIDPATGLIVDANPAAGMFYGYSVEQLKSMSVFALNTLPEADVRALVMQAVNDAQNTFVVKHRLASGVVRDVEIHASRIESEGQPLLFVITHDITDRLEAEQQLQNSVKEKEVLLREVYHRVKNNLSVVASLLNLQSRFVKHPEDAAFFEETKARIQAMGQVHQRLYQSERLSAIDVGAYLKDLIHSISTSYQTPGVSTVLDLDPIPVGLDQAIPCGLIVNELLSNCYKYAFRGRGSGRVTVSCRRVDATRMALSVSDDGVGLSEDVDFSGLKSMGLSLVAMLTDQLDGTLSIDRHNGTTFRIVLPMQQT